jgi:hypothetical protein
MDPRNGYAVGGLILFALVWLALVPAAIWSGFKRRHREARQKTSSQEPTVNLRVTTWQGFAGSLNVNEPQPPPASKGQRPPR